MQKNVVVEVSLSDLLRAAMKHWKVIVASALVFAVLGGLYGRHRANSAAKPETFSTGDELSTEEEQELLEEQEQLYEIQAELYDASSEVSQKTQVELEQLWMQLAKRIDTDPLMNLDSYSCPYSAVVLRFEAQTGNHYGSVYSWLMEADEEKLFGDAKDTLAEYKDYLIWIDDRESETTVRLIAVDGFDAESAAGYLAEYLAGRAEGAGMPVVSVSTYSTVGYDATIYTYQNNIRNLLNTVSSNLNNVNNVENFIPEPSEPEGEAESRQGASSTVIKYAAVGFVGGLVLALLLLMVVITLRQRVISTSQVADSFGIELLGDCSKDSPAERALLEANVDLMAGPDSRLLLLGAGTSVDIVPCVEALNAHGSGRYIAGKDIFEDPETIGALGETDGIIVGVRLDVSRFDDIQNLLYRADKLGKQVLGFVRV